MRSGPCNKTKASIEAIASSSGYDSMLMFPNENSKSQPKTRHENTAYSPGSWRNIATSILLRYRQKLRKTQWPAMPFQLNHHIPADSPDTTDSKNPRHLLAVQWAISTFAGVIRGRHSTVLQGCKWNSCSWQTVPRQGCLLPQANILLPWLLNSINPTGESHGHRSNSCKDLHLFHDSFMCSPMRSNTVLLTTTVCLLVSKHSQGVGVRGTLWWIRAKLTL